MSNLYLAYPQKNPLCHLHTQSTPLLPTVYNLSVQKKLENNHFFNDVIMPYLIHYVFSNDVIVPRHTLCFF